jgi:ABC-type Fe3+ transport system permease subunit
MGDTQVSSKQNQQTSAMNQRRWRNYLLQPLLQFKLGLYNILLTAFFATVLILVIYMSFARVYELVLELTNLRDEVREILNQQVFANSLWLAGVVVVYMISNLLITVVITHKMVGPTVAFRRHIRNLVDGNFQSRVNLRNGDAFTEVADDLNFLAETLEKKSKM